MFLKSLKQNEIPESNVSAASSDGAIVGENRGFSVFIKKKYRYSNCHGVLHRIAKYVQENLRDLVDVKHSGIERAQYLNSRNSIYR